MPKATTFLVYCTSDVFNRLQGCYAVVLSTTGAIVGQQIDRAARYASQYSALDVASRLAHKFNGTAWAAVAFEEVRHHAG
jgi:hypothetical protein